MRVAIGGDNGIPDSRLADEVSAVERPLRQSPRLVIATLPQMFDSMATDTGAACRGSAATSPASGRTAP